MAWIVCNPFLVACFGPNRSMGEGYNGDDDRTCGGLLFCLPLLGPLLLLAGACAHAGPRQQKQRAKQRQAWR